MNEIINFLRSPSASIKIKFGAVYHTELLVKPELPRLFILYITYEDITEPLV